MRLNLRNAFNNMRPYLEGRKCDYNGHVCSDCSESLDRCDCEAECEAR